MENKVELSLFISKLKDSKTTREKMLAYMDCMNEDQMNRLLSMAELIFTR